SDVESTLKNLSSCASKSKNTCSKSFSSKETSQSVKFKTTTRTTSKHQEHLNAKNSKFGYHHEEKNKKGNVNDINDNIEID
ncbi:46163_t:CDS:1, partial [Gigaspora margarita]